MSKLSKPTFSYIYVAWIFVLLGTLLSLYYGEIQNISPCPLCWYQRICLFPLATLFPMIIYWKNASAIGYTLPFSIIGMILAFWQIMQKGFSCIQSGPCMHIAPIYLKLALFSLIGFSAIFLLTVFNLFANSKR